MKYKCYDEDEDKRGSKIMFPEMVNQGRFDQKNNLISEKQGEYKIYAKRKKLQWH